MSRRALGAARSELLSSALLAACAVCSGAAAVASAGAGLATIDAGVTVRRRRPVPLRIECSERNKEEEEDGRTKQKSAHRVVRFSHEDLYLFHRALGVDVVPATGEICLGMEPWHYGEERRALTSSTSIASEREEQGVTPAARKPNTRSSPRRQPAAVHEEEDEGRERRSMVGPLGDKQRAQILKASGVKLPKAKKSALEQPQKESEDEKLEAIRQRRRATCGCSCSADAGCNPASCECSRDGVHCQVDTKEVDGSSFPCACASIDCKNPEGRIEFNELLVRAHHVRTLARLRLGDAIERAVDHRQDG